MNWAQVTAIYGGAFDPPHVGHLEAVRGLFRLPGVSAVRVVPAAVPPQKASAASTEDRIRMTELCFAGLSDVTLDLREVERARAQPTRPSYTFDTLTDLKAELPRLACVVGSDQLARITTWHRFPELLSVCHWIVLSRKPDGEETALAALRDLAASNVVRKAGDRAWKTSSGTELQLVETRAPAVSSSFIRQEIGRTGKIPADSTPAAVAVYLMEHGLYGTEKQQQSRTS